MKKLIKWFSIFAVIGTAVGLAVAYFFKNDSGIEDNDDEDFTEEDEDFDLDADLQPASGREYVSLKKNTKETAEGSSADDASAEKTQEEELQEE